MKKKKYKRMTVAKAVKIEQEAYRRGYDNGLAEGRRLQTNDFKELFRIEN